MSRHHPLPLAALAFAACVARPAPQPAPTASPAAPTAAASAFDRSGPPTLAPPPSVTVPPVVTRELANGLKLLIVEHHELPVVDIILLVNTGSEADPASHAGLATMTAAMLDEGTTTRSALEISDQAAFLGLNLGTGAGWDATRLFMHTPTRQLDSALALLADITVNPSFPVKELDRLKEERLTSLLQLRDRGPAIADRAFANIVFGAGHPYGRSPIGTEASTRQLSTADVQRFYRSHYRPNNAAMIVVGDVRPDDIAARIDRLFGGWERGTVPSMDWRPAPAPSATTVYVIDKPGAPQSSFRIGGVGVPRRTDDYFALLVMNTILGGSFTSRLNQNLRETKGYTYGARSSFDMRTQAGPFTASAEVTGTKTDSSVLEFMKELRGILDTVPSSELQKAKRYLQLGLPGRFETTTDILFQMVPVVMYDLPKDYYNSYVQKIEAVTQSDVQRVARRYVDPSKLAVVIVGDREKVQPTLEALGIGAVTIRDMSGAEIR